MAPYKAELGLFSVECTLLYALELRGFDFDAKRLKFIQIQVLIFKGHTMSLATWVSDELHDVTGMSDRNLAGKLRPTNSDVELFTQHFIIHIKKTFFECF